MASRKKATEQAETPEVEPETTEEVVAERTGDDKSIPSLDEYTTEKTFAKDFLLTLDDANAVPEYMHAANKVDVIESALQRGLRATADVEISDVDVRDQNNVAIVYTVAVEPNTID